MSGFDFSLLSLRGRHGDSHRGHGRGHGGDCDSRPRRRHHDNDDDCRRTKRHGGGHGGCRD
jgi:hypothetical protein